MKKIKNIIRNNLPPLLLNFLHTILPPKHGWKGDYATWQVAEAQCSGYNAANILEKVKKSVLEVKNGTAIYERDSVLFDKLEYSQDILNVFQHIINENNGILDIIDFGGSLGSSYFQYRTLLKNVDKISWSVIEQPHFVECGQKEIADGQLKFYRTIDDCLRENQPKLVFASSVIQYLEKPYSFIGQLVEYKFPQLIIDRLAFIDAQDDRITMQTVPDNIYSASYPAWFFKREKLLNFIQGKDYIKYKEFDSGYDGNIILEKTTANWSGFIFNLAKK